MSSRRPHGFIVPCFAVLAALALSAGRAFAAPDIAVSPFSFSDTLAVGDSLQRSMFVTNNGSDSLHYTLRFASGPGGDSLPRLRPAPFRPAQKAPRAGMRSDRAPAGFHAVAVPAMRDPRRVEAGARRALLIEDAYPWGTNANEQVLALNNIPYDRIQSYQIASTDLGNYTTVIVPSDQTSGYYSNLSTASAQLTTFVTQGGVLEFHAACFGANGGSSLGIVLPGGMTILSSFSDPDSILVPAHPAVQGVPNPFFGSYASHVAFTTVPAGAQIIVQNQFMQPTLVEYRLGSGTVIASGHTLEYGYFSGRSTGQILANLVPYAFSLGTTWLRASAVSGAVPPGGFDEIGLVMDATHLFGGLYTQQIIVESDDPDAPSIPVAVSLAVVGIPDILVAPVVHDFGGVMVGGRDSVLIWMYNRGTDALIGTTSLTGAAGFSGGLPPFSLAPGDSLAATVRFAPDALGPVTGALHVDTNDADAPSVTVDLFGTGIPAPDIGVSPESLLVGLDAGDSLTRIVTVANTGGSDLTFDVFTHGAEADSLSKQSPRRARVVGMRLLPSGSVDAAHPNEDERAQRALSAASIPARGPTSDARFATPGRTNASFHFLDGFEDGNTDGWFQVGPSLFDVTTSTAARGIRSLHQIGSGGHFSGLAAPFNSEHPTALSFYVRCATNTNNTAYVVVSDSLAGIPFYFFASENGTFMVNPNLGGSDSYPYLANTWYHVEFRNVDYDAGRLDYFVNGNLIQSQIPMLTPYRSNVARLDVYNYDGGQQAWWDDIEMSSIPSADWLSATPASGLVPAGGSAELTVLLDAAALVGGTYGGGVEIASNDPDEGSIEVPVRLQVVGIPDIRVQGAERRSESVQHYVNSGDSTVHHLPIPGSYVGGAELDLIAFGDYGDPSEFATLVVEGDTLGSTVYTNNDCLPTGLALVIPEAMFAGWASDGAIDAVVRNSFNVDAFCGNDRHTLTLRVRGSADSVGFIPTFVGACASETLRIVNSGSDVLHVTNLGLDNPAFTVLPVSANVPPGGLQPVVVTFCPTGLGDASATLTITSDDPDAGIITSALNGTGVAPPIMGLSPDSLSAALLSGDSTSVPLTISNTGASELVFQAEALIIATPSPAPKSTQRSELPALQTHWGAPPLPAGGRRFAAPAAASAARPRPRLDVSLPVVLNDPAGDASPPDLVRVRGVSLDDTLHVRLELAANVVPFDFGGAFSMDTDQNPATGVFPSYGNGSQDARVEYEAYLFGIGNGYIDLYSVTLGYVGSFPALVHDNVIEFAIPLTALGGDDGNIDFSGVIGSGIGPTDWFPDTGHGTLLASHWLSLSLEQGTVPAGGTQVVGVSLDATGLFGGGYDGLVVVHGNDPLTPQAQVPVHLQVTGVPRIAAAPDSLNFGTQFTGTSASRAVKVRNAGTEVLNVTSSVTVDGGGSEFSSAAGAFALAPGDTFLVQVTFSPVVADSASGALLLASDDPGQPVLTIPLAGIGLLPPDIAVTPDSILAGLNVGEMTPRVLRIDNTGGSDLNFEIDATPVGLVLAARARRPAAASAARPLTPATGLPAGVMPALEDGRRAATLPVTATAPPDSNGFRDGFEDGDAYGWSTVFGAQVTVTNVTAAHGLYSLQVTNANYGHFSGAYRDFPTSQPDHVSFDLRVPDLDHYAGYCVITNPVGYEAITFFISPGGAANINYFYDYGVYTPNVWHHIEFRDMNWSAKTFDYYVDGVLRLAGVQFQNAPQIQSMSRMYLYNYDGGAVAWYDDVEVRNTPAVQWLHVDPVSGTVPAGGHADVALMLDATALLGGGYDALLAVTSNDPDSIQARIDVPVHLDVTGIPNIAVVPDTVAFGTRFIGSTTTRIVEVSNTGTDHLIATTNLVIAGGGTEFTVLPPSFDLAPSESVLVQVSYAPVAVAASSGTLQILSNDPDQPQRDVALSGQGLVPPEIGVTPDSLLAGLISGETVTRTVRIENTGGSVLTFAIEPEEVATPDSAQTTARADAGVAMASISRAAARAALRAAAVPASMDVKGDPTHAGPEARAALNSSGATALAGTGFFDGFEDGNSNGWTLEPGASSTVVTNETAAQGSYSLRSTAFYSGHFGGARREFGPKQITKVEFDVRLPDTIHNAGYVVLADSLGQDVIWFFAMGSGTFYVNDYSSTYGDVSFPYAANTWYHVEFRNLDWTTKTFDYYVDGALIKAGIPMRNSYAVQNLSWIYLYSFDVNSTAWWDDVELRSAPRWLSANPSAGTVPVGGHADIAVTMDATGLLGGGYDGLLRIVNNDLDEGDIAMPVHLDVTGVPNIAATPDSVPFGPRFIGTTTTRAVQVVNTGTDTLSGTASLMIVGGGTEFTVLPPSFVLAPGDSALVQVSFAPVAPVGSSGALRLISNDPDQPELDVTLSGQGLVPPEIGVTPDSLLAALDTGQQLNRTVRIQNTGGSDLNYSIELQEVAAQNAPQPVTLAAMPTARAFGAELGARSAAMRPAPAASLASAEAQGFAPPPGAWRPAALAASIEARAGATPAGATAAREPDWMSNPAVYPSPEARTLARRAPGATVLAAGGFFDGFEDGNADGWTVSPYSTMQVTNGTAAHGAYSLAVTSTYGGPYAGARRDFGPMQPNTIEFDVRLPDTFHNSGYVVLTDSSGADVILFAAGSNGMFFVSDGYSGENTVPYTANTWYHVEFRNIDWTLKTYDFYVDGVPRRLGLGLRNAAGVQSMSTIHLYNYDYGAIAWWDDIEVNRVPVWLHAAPIAGTVPAGGFADVNVAFDASGLYTGGYDAVVKIESNDIDEGVLQVPVHLDVTGRPDIAVSHQTFDLVSVQPFNYYGALTFHDFGLQGATHTLGAQLDLTVEGDFADPYKTAQLWVEGTAVGTTGPTPFACTSKTFTYPIAPGQFNAWAADGIVLASVVNSGNVGYFCPLNRHILRLRTYDPADTVRFGTHFTGTCSGETLRVANTGTEILSFTGLEIAAPFSLVDSLIVIPAGESRDIAVEFCPTLAGSFMGALTFHSNDPDEAALVVTLTGEALLAPVAAITPAAMSASLLTGGTETQTLHVGNTGGSDLAVSLHVLPLASPQRKAPRMRADSTGDGGLPIVLSDSLGDGGTTDVVALRAISVADSFYFQIDFASPVFFPNFNGVISLDTDSNPLTGIPPSGGLPGQNIGADFEVLMYNVGAVQRVELYRTSPYVYVAGWPVAVGVSEMRFALPLAALDGDDGDLDFTGAVGTYDALVDWFPESGHGEVRGLSWITLDARDLMVPAGDATDVGVHFDAAGLESGDYLALIRAVTNDPQRLQVDVPAQLHVTGAPDIALRPDSVAFGDVALGDTGNVMLWVSNRGTDALAGSLVAGTNGGGSLFGPQVAVPFALAAHESVAVSIQFQPSSTGPASGVLTVTSNDGDEPSLAVPLTGVGIVGPHLTMTPDHLDETVMIGTSQTFPMQLGNTGDRPLHWTATTVVTGPPVVEASVEPMASLMGAQPKTSATLMPTLGYTGSLVTLAPSPSSVPASSRVTPLRRGLTPARSGTPRTQALSLEDMRTRLDERASNITAAIPNRWDFIGGASGYSILDGGGDMYDTGNLIATSLGGPIAYSDAGVNSSLLFGNAGRYTSRKYPGLFVFAADLDSVNAFDVYGELGADGTGFVDGAVLSMSANGSNYKGFVKRVYGANGGDPSVNHLVVVKESPTLSQSFSNNTNDDFHEIQGLRSSSRLYLLVYAGTAGTYIDNTATAEIMRRFLDAVEPTWIYASPESGTVAPGGTGLLNVTLNATDLAMGDHGGELHVLSNDPIQADFSVTVTLHADTTTAVALSLVEARAEPGAAHLTWHAPGGVPVTATVYRREEQGPWAALGSITSDGEGMLRFDDADVRAGGRYGYRLGVVENGIEDFSDEVRIEVPTTLAFALHGPLPNPASPELRVSFTLPGTGAASLELLDLAGRRLALREVGTMGGGQHVVALGEGRPVPAGVYLVRLTRGTSTLTRKAVVVQ